MCTKNRRNRKLTGKFYSKQSRNVSWTISDSESDHEVAPKKTALNNSWIQLITPVKPRVKQLRTLLTITEHVVNERESPGISHENVNNRLPVRSQQEEFNSPIIGALKLGECSPILSQHSVDQSPVINNQPKIKRIKEIRRNLQKERLIENPTSSSDESSFVISPVESEAKTQSNYQIDNCKTQPELPLRVSQASETANERFTIESVSSQDRDQIQNNEEDTNAGFFGSDSSLLSGKLHTVRKRKYRKNGPASELQKAVDTHKNRLALWEHSMFVKKNFSTCAKHQEEVEFLLLSRKSEFGSSVLHCLSNDDSNRNEFVIIIVSLNSVCKVNLTENRRYKLFPPYCSKIVIFDLKETCCFYNCSRFIPL